MRDEGRATLHWQTTDTSTDIIGIAAATEPRRTGCALAHLREGGTLVVERVALGDDDPEPATVIAHWLAGTGRALVTVGAPLGWPLGLTSQMVAHQAGKRVHQSPEQLLRRLTDDVLHREYGIRPREVGAERIGRTAVSALDLLSELRARVGSEIPLAWDPGGWAGFAAIEVCPAATFASLGMRARGYKRNQSIRQGLLRWLEHEGHLSLSDALQPDEIVASEHVFDAVLCAVAGGHFLLGQCRVVIEPEIARKEGWVQVRRSRDDLVPRRIPSFDQPSSLQLSAWFALGALVDGVKVQIEDLWFFDSLEECRDQLGRIDVGGADGRVMLFARADRCIRGERGDVRRIYLARSGEVLGYAHDDFCGPWWGRPRSTCAFSIGDVVGCLECSTYRVGVVLEAPATPDEVVAASRLEFFCYDDCYLVGFPDPEMECLNTNSIEPELRHHEGPLSREMRRLLEAKLRTHHPDLLLRMVQTARR